MKVTPDRWRQIRKVLDAALEVSPDERPAWLATRCGEDTELRAEVESLLASHEEVGDLLETNAVAPPVPEPTTLSLLAIGAIALRMRRRRPTARPA